MVCGGKPWILISTPNMEFLEMQWGEVCDFVGGWGKTYVLSSGGSMEGATEEQRGEATAVEHHTDESQTPYTTHIPPKYTIKPNH